MQRPCRRPQPHIAVPDCGCENAATCLVEPAMKLNMGCGHRKLPGYVNVDVAAECSPDLICDLEQFPWPWASDSVDTVVFCHSLEHLGAQVEVFKGIMQELYRVCRPGATITIHVPHPRHDDFITDPTHVRAITPDTMALLSKKANEEWRAIGAANSPLATYWDVDFEIQRVDFSLAEPYHSRAASGELTHEQVFEFIQQRNNVVKEIRIALVAIKRESAALGSASSASPAMEECHP
jgi:SAM-dependent methyltransferase